MGISWTCLLSPTNDSFRNWLRRDACLASDLGMSLSTWPFLRCQERASLILTHIFVCLFVYQTPKPWVTSVYAKKLQVTFFNWRERKEPVWGAAFYVLSVLYSAPGLTVQLDIIILGGNFILILSKLWWDEECLCILCFIGSKANAVSMFFSIGSSEMALRQWWELYLCVVSVTYSGTYMYKELPEILDSLSHVNEESAGICCQRNQKWHSKIKLCLK